MVFLAISTAVATIIASLIAGIASFFGVRSTNQQNVANTQATNDLQRQLAGQANNWQEQMWERQNAYNDPSSQVARLAGANLNPAMIMSQGGIMNEAGSVGSSHMPVMNVPQVQNPVDPSVAADIALKSAQTKSIEHQTQREDEKQPLTLESMLETINQIKSTNEQIMESINGIKLDNDRKVIENDIISQTKDLAVQQFKDNAFITSETAKYCTLGILADIGLKEAQEEYNRALASKSAAEKEEIEQLVRLNQLYYNMDKSEFDWLKENWNAQRPFLRANAKNEAAMMFRNAEGRRLANTLVARYGDVQALFGVMKDMSDVVENATESYTNVAGKKYRVRGSNFRR